MKKLSIFGKSVPLLALVMISILVVGAGAALLTSYGTITTTADVDQSLTLDGFSYPDSDTVIESISGIASNTIYGDPHYLTNMAAKTVYASLTSTETDSPIGGEGGLATAYPEYKLDATVDDDAFSLILDSSITWSTFTGITFDYLIETGPNTWIPQINIGLRNPAGEVVYGVSWNSFRTTIEGVVGTPASITYDKDDFYIYDSSFDLMPGASCFWKDAPVPLQDAMNDLEISVITQQAGETSIDPNPPDKLQVVSVSRHAVGGGTLAGIGVLPITSGAGPAAAVLDFTMVYIFDVAAMPGTYEVTTTISPYP